MSPLLPALPDEPVVDKAGRPLARGVRAVVLLFLAVAGLTGLIGVAARRLLPDPQLGALIAIAALTVAVLLARPWFGSWAALGLQRRVNRPVLLAVPTVLALLPLTFGVELPEGRTLAVLLVGYLLTGFTEELLWRGMALAALEWSRPLVAVLLSSALFGLSHLVNLLYRDNPALVLAQVWGAFCFGVGYAAIRRRTGSILWLMVLHAVTDFAGAITAGPALLFFIGQDAVLLAFGLVLVLREQRSSRT